MRVALLVVVLAAGCKPGGVSREQELCAAAAMKFSECEDTGSADAIQREIVIDRWRGLCRAVFSGKTDQMFPDVVQLFEAMDDATKAGLREQAECTSKAKTCVEYAACSE